MIKLPVLIAALWGGFIAVSAAASGELPGLNSLLMPVTIIILLIILNGLFVAAEFAIIAVRPTQIEQMAREGNGLAKPVLTVLQSADKQNRYIATAQLGITIASLGLGMYGEPQISHFIEPWMAKFLGVSPHDTLIISTGYLISLALLTYLHVVAGEMIPKSLALSAPDKAALGVAQPMHIMQTVLAGPVWLLNGTGAVLLRLFRIPPVQGEERLHTPEELEMIVQESAQGGLLYPSEETIIRNILDFAGREVHQVMTPRPKVQAIPVDMPLPDMLEIVTISNFSRFPVYETNLDQIIGIIHIKDLVRQVLRPTDNFDIRLLLRPVHLVPEHYSVDKLLTTFKRRHHHMAIALDEFGGTAGIVTLEDLVEEVVGEVRDEFDLENEPLIKLGPGKLEVAGDFLLDDLADYVNLGKEENLPLHVETVGGLIMAKLGRIPQTGDTVTLENQVTLQTLSVTGLAVDRAQVNFSEPLQNSEE